MPIPHNHLLTLLPSRERRRLESLCEPIELELSAIVCEPGDRLHHVHFPTDSFISLLAVDAEKSTLEVGMIGREGMLGMHEVLGVTQAPTRALVQGAGRSLRMATAHFRSELQLSVTLRAVLLRYVHVSMQQLATSALCMRYHALQPRLARWLLMTQDRAGSDRFQVTQEFLSSMLGVRRVGVTAAAQALQAQGLIEYHRGAMHVRNRDALQTAACPCYASDGVAYRAQLSGRTP